MPDEAEIYAKHAEQYERLVAREDYQGNILRALEQIIPLAGLDVAELGAGTARLTRLLAPFVRSILAFDRSPHMLGFARTQLQRSGSSNWRLAVCDHRRVPAAREVADVALAGWSICYLKVWQPQEWEAEVGKALREMRRLVRQGGSVVLLETLGTGTDVPQPPEHLGAYYDFLERQGYRRKWIRTDYRFRDRAEAEQVACFFFGAAIADKFVEVEGSVLLPECTGLWWQEVT